LVWSRFSPQQTILMSVWDRLFPKCACITVCTILKCQVDEHPFCVCPDPRATCPKFGSVVDRVEMLADLNAVFGTAMAACVAKAALRCCCKAQLLARQVGVLHSRPEVCGCHSSGPGAQGLLPAQTVSSCIHASAVAGMAALRLMDLEGLPFVPNHQQSLLSRHRQSACTRACTRA